MNARAQIHSEAVQASRRGVPRFALTEQEVADSIGVSASTLANLISEKLFPAGFQVPGHPRLIRWDPDDVRNAVQDWKMRANPGNDGGWGEVR